MEHYQGIVVGAGTAGIAAARRMRAEGWRVAVVDNKPFGGTCALHGCTPKKMLHGVTEALDHFWRMKGNGLEGEVSVNWVDMIKFKRSYVDPIPANTQALFDSLGIDTYRGDMKFTGENSIDVAGVALGFDKLLMATGAEAARLPIDGFEHLATNVEFLSMARLPNHIVFMGGGYIAAEFSHIAARAGAKVTIIQSGPRLLPPFEPELVEMITPKFTELGIRVHYNARLNAVKKTDNGFQAVIGPKDGAEFTIDADLVVHAAGRGPITRGFDLDAGNVALDGRFFAFNADLQSTSNPRVYFAGDAAQAGFPLTPVSMYDGAVIGAIMVGDRSQIPNHAAVASAVYTIPPIASVGMSEAQARETCAEIKVNFAVADGYYTAKQANEPIYGFKTIVDANSDLILGAHLIGPRVDEVINVFALAMRHGLTASQVRDTIYSFPTTASDLPYML